MLREVDKMNALDRINFSCINVTREIRSHFLCQLTQHVISEKYNSGCTAVVRYIPLYNQ